MRKNFLVINTYSSLAYQAVTVACGFILPRLILVHYGSAVNGLVNSIIQFLGVITYLDFGITAVVQSALYKPLAEKNMNEVSQIIASAGNFFRRIAYALIIYICILIYMFPNIINADFSSTYMGILIVAISINLFANYYFGLKNQLLIAADQKIYITYLVQIFTLIVNTLLCAILIECDMSIQFVYSATATIFLIRPLYYWMYVNQHYQLKKKIKLTVEPIKQKWNGIAQHIAAVVIGGTDSIVLTLFSTLENVSIYAVYYLVINGLVKLFVSSTTGFQSHYGMLWAEHRIGELLKSFNRFVWGIHTGVIFIFGCTSILIVPFVVVLLGGEAGWFGDNSLLYGGIALAIFIVASLTDLIDGKIARKYNLVTDFGKFMDPLADKLLVSAAMIALVEMGRIPAWVVIVIISREFIISGFRLVASDNGVVIAASYWGKFKTTFQMVMVCLMLLDLSEKFAWYGVLTNIIMWIALILTVVSLVDYLMKNKNVLKEQK